MQELIKQLTEKVGINPEQAQGAIDTVLGFVKDKLPAGMGDQLDGIMSGNASGFDLSSLGDIAGGLGDKIKDGIGGIFGK